MKLHIAAFASLLALAAPAYANTQTISFVETEDFNSDPLMTAVSGKVLYQDANGAYNRAVTAIGTNKIYSKGNGTSELNAGSAWMDSYTVGGTGTVNVSLSFTVDGISAVGANVGGPGHDDNPFDWSYRVLALKGDNWNLGGQGGTTVVPGTGWPIRSPGDSYESMLLTRTAPGDPTITNTFQPRFGTSTVWNVKNFGEENASFASSIQRSGNNVSVYALDGLGNPRRYIYQPTRLLITDGLTGTILQTLNYSNNPQLLTAYANLLNSYPILGQTGLCTLGDDGLCPGTETYDPTTLTLNFSLQAGEKFTVLSYLSHINLRDGEFDFFNTAKLSGITVSPGATLTSDSGALQQLAGGGYGYAPLALGVPEPAQWALMIGGFGFVGAASRRRQRQAAKATSIAVGAPRNA